MQYILSEEELNKATENSRLARIAEKNISVICHYYHNHCIRWPNGIVGTPVTSCDKCPLSKTISNDPSYSDHCMAKRPKGFK